MIISNILLKKSSATCNLCYYISKKDLKFTEKSRNIEHFLKMNNFKQNLRRHYNLSVSKMIVYHSWLSRSYSYFFINVYLNVQLFILFLA